MNSEMKKQSGFTLIELMIVVAIVAILAAVALPAYQNYTKKAKMTEVASASGAYKTAIEICYQSKGFACALADILSGGSETKGANSTSKCDTRLCRLTVLFEYLDRLPESETFPRS